MKLSKRETIMLILLIIVALVFIEFRFVISPGLDRYEALQTRQRQVTAQVDQVMLNIAALENLQNKLDENLDEIKDLSKPYFDGIQTDVLLNYSRDILLQNEMTIVVYTPNPTQLTKITVPEDQLQETLYKLKELARNYKESDQEADEPDQPNQPGSEEPLADDLELFKLNLSVTGTYDQLRSLLTDIERERRAMRVNDMTISVGEQDEMLSMNFTLEFYGLDKLVPDRMDPLAVWPRPSFDGGSENPYPVNITPVEVIDEEETAQ
ncbi:MAG: GspMb/PilO family protein [Bacillota bacterium]|nr:GspMb/PilO family protein [Bacillota bacterium]